MEYSFACHSFGFHFVEISCADLTFHPLFVIILSVFYVSIFYYIRFPLLASFSVLSCIFPFLIYSHKLAF